MIYKNHLKAAEYSGNFLVLLSGLIGLVVLLWPILWADRGLDLTDEAYYLLFIANPADVDASASLFGFILHPVYEALGQSVTGLRMAGMIVLAVTGAALAWVLMPPGQSPGTLQRLRTVSVYIAAATGPLLYYFWWIPTPSYNWLNVWSGLLLCVSLGLLLKQRLVGSALLAGLAGVIDFIAKPPSAVLFALVYVIGIVAVLPSAKAVLVQIGRAFIATALVIGLILAFGVAPKEVVEAYSGFWETFASGTAGTSLDASYFARFALSWLGASYLLTLVAVLLVIFVVPIPIWAAALVVLSSLAMIAIGAMGQQGDPRLISNIGIGVASMSIILMAGSINPNKDVKRLLFILLLMAVLPWAVAFGTSNDLIRHQAFGLGLPALAALLAASTFPRPDLPVGLAAMGVVCFSAASLALGFREPYRLVSPLWHQDLPVPIGQKEDALRTDASTRDFLLEVRQIASSRGFEAGSPVLDLTGYTPGIVVALGGKAPALPWILGGYPFSNELLRFVLSRMDPEEQKSAWLIHSDAPVPFKREVLESLGIKLDTNYVLAGEAYHPVEKTWIRLYAPKS